MSPMRTTTNGHEPDVHVPNVRKLVGKHAFKFKFVQLLQQALGDANDRVLRGRGRVAKALGAVVRR